jgi:hypothetical protein
MSQSRSSQLNRNTAEQMAADFIEARRLKHLDFTMTAPAGTETHQAGAGAAGSTGGAGGEGAPSGDGGAGAEGSGDPNKKISALEEEKDRHYQARQAAEAELQKYKDAEDERNRAANDEVTNLKNDLAKAQETLANTQAALDAALLDNAFLTENTHAWQNPARVLKLVDREAVKIEDGKVVGVKEALEALAKSDPYLLKPAEGSAGEGSGSQTGGATGQQAGGRRTEGGNGKSREDLARKYPALRR